MKKIKIKFTDFWNNFNYEDNLFLDLLKQKYDVEISDNPEYVICSVMGWDALKYDAVRICFTGENVHTDFNIYDYGVGFDWYSCDDRYLRMPLYALYRQRLDAAKEKHIVQPENYWNKHTRFCNFVYSNSHNVMAEREQILDLLNTYKQVDCGGKYRNNVGGPVEDKMDFLSNYKFTIAVENTSTPGYTTEKIIEAFAAQTIPIYYGNPMIAKEFNEKAFINCHNYESMEEVLQEVIRLDEDEKAFLAMLKQPILMEETVAGTYSMENTLLPFLQYIIEQPLDKAYRRDRYGWGKVYEERLKKMYALKTNPIIKKTYAVYRKLRG